jgi:tRNA pseudouridine synthase 10
LYETSVEKIISEPFVKNTKGNNSSFHGAGREDIDVRMLGNGRPFVLEINNPMIRTIPLDIISKEINEKNKDIVEIHNLHFCDKKEIKRIKGSAFKKVYLVEIEGKNEFKREKLLKVALALRGKTIEQFTPTRVAKRRANKIRRRQIYECNLEQLEEKRASFTIESESGTYIKELITGDEGKTIPSFSELIGQPCTVITLDVIEIKGE